MKTFKEFKNRILEDGEGGAPAGGAPANNVGSGNIAGVGVGPAGEPGVKPKDGIIGQGFGKRKKKKSIVMGMLKRNIKENFDNNNVILKQVLDGLDKVDTFIDFSNTGKVGIPGVIQEKKEPRKSFKDKYKIK